MLSKVDISSGSSPLNLSIGIGGRDILLRLRNLFDTLEICVGSPERYDTRADLTVFSSLFLLKYSCSHAPERIATALEEMAKDRVSMSKEEGRSRTRVS